MLVCDVQQKDKGRWGGMQEVIGGELGRMHRTPPSRLPVMKKLLSCTMHVIASKEGCGCARTTDATLEQNLEITSVSEQKYCCLHVVIVRTA